MRSRAVLSAAFVVATVAPVMSVPAPTPDRAGLSRFPGRKSVSRWTPPIPLPTRLAGRVGRTCKRQDIETEIVNVTSAAVQQGVITRDEANTFLQLPQLMTNSDDSLLLLRSLVTDPTSLLPDSTGGATANNTRTQKKRDWWTPPPIPSCWRSSSCERTVKWDWTPPTPSPPSIPSCWWSQTCKRDVAGGRVTQPTVESLINQAVKAGVFTPTYGDTLDGLLPFSTQDEPMKRQFDIIGDIIKGVAGAGTGVGCDRVGYQVFSTGEREEAVVDSPAGPFAPSDDREAVNVAWILAKRRSR